MSINVVADLSRVIIDRFNKACNDLRSDMEVPIGIVCFLVSLFTSILSFIILLNVPSGGVRVSSTVDVLFLLPSLLLIVLLIELMIFGLMSFTTHGKYALLRPVTRLISHKDRRFPIIIKGKHGDSFKDTMAHAFFEYASFSTIVIFLMLLLAFPVVSIPLVILGIIILVIRKFFE